MATCLYVNPDPATVTFGNALGCGWVHEVPAAFRAIATAPCVIVSGAGQTTVIPDDGALTAARVATPLAPILAAEQAAAVAAASQATNTATLQAALDARLATIEAFIAANPGGAVLTGPQTLVVAKMLAGLVRLLRNNVGSIGQGG